MDIVEKAWQLIRYEQGSLKSTPQLKQKLEQELLQAITRMACPQDVLQLLEITKEIRALPYRFKTRIYEVLLNQKREPSILRNYAFHLLCSGEEHSRDKAYYFLMEAFYLESQKKYLQTI